MSDSVQKLSELTEDTLQKHDSLNESSSKSTSTDQTSSQKSFPGTIDTSLNLNPLYEIWKDVVPEVLNRGAYPKIPIGLNALDEILWGLHRKEILVIAARPGNGKSAFVCFLTKQVADQGLKVAFFSNEMSKEQLALRLFVNVCKVNNQDLRKGLAKHKVMEFNDMFIGWAKNTKILLDDENGYTIGAVEKVCKVIQPDVVIVDYVQMLSTVGFRRKLDAIENYVQGFKKLSKSMNFAGVLISQINRVGTGSPEMEHLKGAGVLEEHPDTVVTLKWDWEDAENPQFYANVKKQREGEVRNKIKLSFMPQFYDFSDYEY